MLSGYSSVLGKCRAGAAGDLKIKFTVGADGGVSGVSASGSLAGSPAEACAVGKFKTMRFKKSDGSKDASYTLP